MRTRARGFAAAIVIATIAACTAIELGSRHQQLTALDTTSYDFGPVSLGFVASGGPFTVKPAGGSAQMDNDYIQAIKFDTMCPDFALQDGGGAGYGGMMIGSSDGNLYAVNGGPHIYWNCTGTSGSGTGAAGGTGTTGCLPVTYQFDATFTPSSTNPQQCVARVYTMSGSGAGPGSSNTITFSGSGQGSSYSISASPTKLDFGTVQQGSSSASQTVTVTNTGTSNITISGFYNDVVYNVVPSVGNPVSLVPGMGQTYTIYCAPSDTSSHDDMLIFTGNGSASATVTLACTGTSLNLGILPEPVDFNSQLVGAPPQTRTVTITDPTGSPPVNLTGWGFTNQPPRISFAQQPLSMVNLVGGASTQVIIKYDPSAPDTSGSLGSFVFTANGTPYSVPLIGTTLVGSLGANPASVDFGPVCAGGAGSAIDVQVSTNAAGAVKVTNVEPPSAPFGASAAGIPATLAGGGMGSITVHASIAPAGNAMPGPIASAIKLDTNIPGSGATVTIPVSATVLQGGIGITPASVSFGPEMLHTLSEGKQIVLTNCGSAALTIMDARISPPTETEFSIEAPANPAMLNKTLQLGESQMFAVQFKPSIIGHQAAKLVLDTDAGLKEIPLDGDGYGGSGGSGGGKERETYYACSTGGPVGMLPLALAGIGLALAGRRRRRR